MQAKKERVNILPGYNPVHNAELPAITEGVIKRFSETPYRVSLNVPSSYGDPARLPKAIKSRYRYYRVVQLCFNRWIKTRDGELYEEGYYSAVYAWVWVETDERGIGIGQIEFKGELPPIDMAPVDPQSDAERDRRNLPRLSDACKKQTRQARLADEITEPPPASTLIGELPPLIVTRPARLPATRVAAARSKPSSRMVSRLTSIASNAT